MGDPAVRVVFRRGARTGRGEPPRTAALTALLDAAAEVDEDELVSLTARAISQEKLTPTQILAGLDARRATRHSALLRELCGEAGQGVESILEWRFMQEVVLAHGLPEPTRQVRLLMGSRSDAVWDEFGLVAELDGQLGHEDKFRDMARDNRLVLKGFTTLRYGWHDVRHRPCESAWQVASALQITGWTGQRERCRRCRRARMN